MDAKEIVEQEVARQAGFGMEPSWEDFVLAGYREGKREGLTLYAWWKDGVQYVGTCGRTLEQALREDV